jgi:hypothetical protein
VLKLTLPVGAEGEPAPVSVTVAAHPEELPTVTDAGAHETAVAVDRAPPPAPPRTTTVPWPLLAASAASPRYEAVIVWVPEPIAVGV